MKVGSDTGRSDTGGPDTSGPDTSGPDAAESQDSELLNDSNNIISSPNMNDSFLDSFYQKILPDNFI